MSQYNNLGKYSRSHHNQILTKTEIALEAIKKYQARSNRLTQKNKHMWSNPYSIFKQIDDHYTRVHYHRELHLDKITRAQIFPHNQEYYFISTQNVLFPVRIFLKNVRNEGVLYVGFDREFPGVQRIDDHTKVSKEYESQKRIYDYKFSFDKDLMCVLKNQRKKSIHKIFLTIVAKKQLLMLNLKYDYIGYESYMPPQENTRIKRAVTEGTISMKNTNSKGFQLPSPSPLKRYHQTMRQSELLLGINKKSNGLRDEQSLKRSKTENEDLFSPTKQTQGDDEQKKNKNFVQINQNKLLSHKRQKSQQIAQQKKQKAMQAAERTKANREQLQQYKQKERQIKEAASKLKKAIEHYQKLYREQRLRDRKILNNIGPLMYMSIFMLKSNIIYNKQTQSITKTFTVRYLIKKFTKGLRKKYIQNILMIGNFKARNQMSCLHLFQLAARIVQPMQKRKGAELIFAAFKDLQPALILNHSLNKSSNYRQKCRIIQRRWILKYRARVAMLQNFANRHVQSMLKQFPHLRLGQNAFKTGNHCHKVCVEYMIDESAKFKQIYGAYRKRIQQIDDFIAQNYKIQQYNKGKPQSKKKKYLDIPKKPTPPQHRFFRNLDILKSMLRGWFEIQYKKILKKSSAGK